MCCHKYILKKQRRYKALAPTKWASSNKYLAGLKAAYLQIDVNNADARQTWWYCQSKKKKTKAKQEKQQQNQSIHHLWLEHANAPV